jgi:hypothetical protein
MEKDFNKLMIQRDWFIIQYGTLNAQYSHNLMPHLGYDIWERFVAT